LHAIVSDGCFLNTDSFSMAPAFIVRACFSQERMIYVPDKESDDGVAKVVYISKDRKSRKVFNALDWLARLVTHIPSRYEQTVRYYGFMQSFA
jgi:hypothetical protein